MIVVVGGIKGGSGKTTIATNLTVMRAHEGKKVLLVDGDEQKSASVWANQRDAKEIATSWTTVAFSGKAIHSQLLRMKHDYDDIIIDVGGRETSSQRAAIAIADVYLIPFKPRSLDIWTLGDVKTVVSEMRLVNPNLQAYAIINQGDAKGPDNEDAFNILQECEDLKCVPITIGSRKAFANAASEGLSVIEMKNLDKKAVQEIRELYEFLYIKCMSTV